MRKSMLNILKIVQDIHLYSDWRENGGWKLRAVSITRPNYCVSPSVCPVSSQYRML